MDRLPDDIAEAIEALKKAAFLHGLETGDGTGTEDAAGRKAEAAHDALDAAILKRLSGDEAVDTERQALADRMEAWLHGSFYRPGEMPSSSMQASIGGLVCQHMPIVLAALRAVPAADLGRSALAEEGGGK